MKSVSGSQSLNINKISDHTYHYKYPSVEEIIKEPYCKKEMLTTGQVLSSYIRTDCHFPQLKYKLTPAFLRKATTSGLRYVNS